MKLVVVFLLLFAILPAGAQLTPDQVAKCASEGGCLTMTREGLGRALEQAHAAGQAVGASQRCWRPA